MSKQPILFSSEMVLAILEGRKTMTRRVVKWKPCANGEQFDFNSSVTSLGHYCTDVPESGYVLYSRGRGGVWNQRTKPVHCRWRRGDTLWVRETWEHVLCESCEGDLLSYRCPYQSDEEGCYNYRATDRVAGAHWHPSIFMPCKAARVFLSVRDVRVQRLQDITDVDARKEGVESREEFRVLWDRLNSKRGFRWAVNPYVWVIEFENISGQRHNAEFMITQSY
ncbi:hypothetical protein CEB3_c17880 [Peptococcaceae bacterium CEB3]|nr:hypothetical protein CEB3_c17880 [Peptococcaceae bacterium CEB3]